jgi:hypothetical protein
MNYYLVFYKDNGDREGANVYYSWLTQETSKRRAILIVAIKMNISSSDLEAEKMDLI